MGYASLLFRNQGCAARDAGNQTVAYEARYSKRDIRLRHLKDDAHACNDRRFYTWGDKLQHVDLVGHGRTDAARSGVYRQEHAERAEVGIGKRFVQILEIFRSHTA